MRQTITILPALLLSVVTLGQVHTDANGNVGVGTTTPAAKLHVNGSQIIETSGSGANRRTLTIKQVGTSQINFGSYHGAWRSSLQIQNNDATKALFLAPPENDYNYSILRAVNGGMRLDVGGTFTNTGTTALSIEPNGNVGIGTQGPQAKLHVEGVQLVNGGLRLGSHHNDIGYGRAIEFGYQSNSDPVWMARYNVAGDQSELRLNLGDDGNDRFTIGYHHWGNGNWTLSFFVNSAGQVGINTTDTKGYALGVNGSAIFTKAVVKQYGNWPDYVFSSSYTLPPLQEVESFIKQHKHLPDVPSADEVEKNGLDLGENQAVLLRKIEELTLYVLELNRKVDHLQKSNEELKVKNQSIKSKLATCNK